MGVDLELEVDTGDVLQILRPDGGFGGKAIYVLANIYSNYKHLFKPGSWEFGWFRKLDQFTEKDPGMIHRIMYAGNWDHTAEEYDRVQVRAAAGLWTPIDEVIEVVSELVGILPKMGAETCWFSPQDTIQDFCGLLNALVLAKTRCGRNVRLRCTEPKDRATKRTGALVKVKAKLYSNKA